MRREAGTCPIDGLGWSLFFILLGAIPLATRLGILDPQVVGRWPAPWPLLLVAWGLGLLLRRTPHEWIGGGLTVLVFGLMGGGALAAGFGGVPGMTGCGGEANGTDFATQRGTFGASGQLKYRVQLRHARCRDGGRIGATAS